jgi:UDP-N-acetyl-D-galactosamine dehydrogenase
MSVEKDFSDSLLPSFTTCTVCVVGLGYVGLPLAVELSKIRQCHRTSSELNRRIIGFDINSVRVSELKSCIDRTNEISLEDLENLSNLEFTTDPDYLKDADIFIVTVPTPIDKAKRPDLTAMKKASAMIGAALKDRLSTKIPIIIFESTVYPGATEEVCVPIIEKNSSLIYNKDFACGYSPERINPGDNVRKLTSIVKVTSGSTLNISLWIDAFYASIIKAGTHRASSIKVAEAAKVIENTQRDLNIALMNELSIIFSLMDIDTLDVLSAAGTKWNFLPFKPGLVGGHCIGVDPYYLTHKAEELGYSPQVVLAGRRINDGMGSWLVDQLILYMARQNQIIAGSEVLILGLTFKENCPDLRNTRVVDVISSIKKYKIEPTIVDPWVDPREAQSEYGLTVLRDIPSDKKWNAVLVIVAHNEFLSFKPNEWTELLSPSGIILDLKGILPREVGAIRP